VVAQFDEVRPSDRELKRICTILHLHSAIALLRASAVNCKMLYEHPLVDPQLMHL
jgi:hypothetical protein